MTLWGGRFTGETDALMRQFNDSFGFDRRLYAADIQGSIAYAEALVAAGLISDTEWNQLVDGLRQVGAEFAEGTFEPADGDEDIHTAAERRLGELVGEVAGKLHTGRSRNDQVATDLKLYLLQEIKGLRAALIELQSIIVEKAEVHLEVLMPGYTHLQQAQPILFSHWLMAAFWKLDRDRGRLEDMAKRACVCPLGAGALAGNPFDVDRQALAEALGFEGPTPNSIDAVNDRDYVVEFLSWAALTQTHLSGLAEDLIIWATRAFGFVEIDDAYATGSSLMPQKKNPDSLELVRGKTGRVAGHLTGLLTTLKGLPTAYNKDLQEDKEPLFDVLDTLKVEFPVVTGVIQTLRIDETRMAAALDEAMLATDLADYLVRKGLPFRETHHLVGQVVRRAEATDVPLSQLDIETYQTVSAAFEADVYEVFDFQRSVAARAAEGGTAPQAVTAQIEQARARIESALGGAEVTTAF